MADADDRPIYFLHIPKTAGSSVSLWLAQRVRGSAMCQAKIWDQLVQCDEAGLAECRIFAGHYGIELDRYLGVALRTMTVFRDPLQRTFSHYLHVRRDTNHPWHPRVSPQSFEVFLRDSQNWPMVENFQARYLVRSGLDMRRFTRRLDTSPGKLSRLSTTSEDVRYLFDQGYVREQSHAALDGIDVVGTTDRIPLFLEQAARTFSLESDGSEAVPRENVAPDRSGIESISQASLDLVAELTAIDQSLFQAARLREKAGMLAGRPAP